MAIGGKGNERFSVTIDPSPKAIAAAFGVLGKGFDDWRPAFQSMVYPVFVKGLERNFATQGASLGDPWPALSPSYFVRKKRLGSRLMLKLTGRLRGTLHVVKMNKRLISYGSTLPYARAVQYGKGRIGKRRYAAWSDSMKATAIQKMNEFGEALVKKAHEKMMQQGGPA
jgi:hypothetical protein